MAKETQKRKTKRLTRRAFHEVHQMTPKIVIDTMLTKGFKRAEQQRVAIALNKARQGGARIPRRKM
jgi:hypothetical protein